METENIIYLSKRNLLSLLSKVSRFESGDETKCTLIKYANPLDPYCMHIAGEDRVAITAIPDNLYYANREAGPVLDVDEPLTGVQKDAMHTALNTLKEINATTTTPCARNRYICS